MQLWRPIFNFGSVWIQDENIHSFDVGWSSLGGFFFGKLKQLDELYCPGTLSQRIANAVHYVLMKNYSLPCATVEVLRGPSCQFSRRNKDKSWDVSFGQECNLCPQEGCIPTWSPCHILHLQSRWNPWIQKFRCVSSTKVFESLDFYRDLVVSCSVLRLFLSRSHLPHSGWVSDGCHGELRGRIGLSLTYRFATVLSHSLH